MTTATVWLRQHYRAVLMAALGLALFFFAIYLAANASSSDRPAAPVPDEIIVNDASSLRVYIWAVCENASNYDDDRDHCAATIQNAVVNLDPYKVSQVIDECDDASNYSDHLAECTVRAAPSVNALATDKIDMVLDACDDSSNYSDHMAACIIDMSPSVQAADYARAQRMITHCEEETSYSDHLSACVRELLAA